MATDVVGLSRHYSLGFFPSSPSSLLAASTSSSLSCPARPVSRPYKRFGRSCLLGITNGPRRQFASFKAQAAITETDKDQPKWWERNAGPNMVDIHSTQEFLSALSQAGDKLVIVEFYGSWCASCKALFPKLCRTAAVHPEILLLKVNFDENKPMCKSLNVKVLPYFHFYEALMDSWNPFQVLWQSFRRSRTPSRRTTQLVAASVPQGASAISTSSLSLCEILVSSYKGRSNSNRPTFRILQPL